MSTGSTLVIDGLRTKVQVRGEGPPLLLIGGLWSQVGLWDDLVPQLHGFRTIAFDPPGLGATEMPRRPYTVKDLAAFAAGVLDALGVERAHVLGVSLGGAVAQQLARSHPDRVDRLVLVSTGFGAPGWPGRPDVLLRFPVLTRTETVRELEKMAGHVFGGRLREDPSLVRDYAPAAARRDEGLALPARGVAGVEQPALAAPGRPADARRARRRRPDRAAGQRPGRSRADCLGARLHVLKGGGHLLLLDSATEVLPTITDFLAESGT